MKGLLHGLVGFGVLAFVAKLYKWNDSAFFFDGTGLGMYIRVAEIVQFNSQLTYCMTLSAFETAAYICAIAVYASVTIPSLRTIVQPLPNVDSQDDRVEAMRILAAGNTIMIVLLGSILVLQVREKQMTTHPYEAWNANFR
jgi:heme/copper-type cytochrome/quinol oxidase subunit 4